MVIWSLPQRDSLCLEDDVVGRAPWAGDRCGSADPPSASNSCPLIQCVSVLSDWLARTSGESGTMYSNNVSRWIPICGCSAGAAIRPFLPPATKPACHLENLKWTQDADKHCCARHMAPRSPRKRWTSGPGVGFELPDARTSYEPAMKSASLSSGCLSACSYRRCSSSIGRRTRGAAIVSPPEMDRRVRR